MKKRSIFIVFLILIFYSIYADFRDDEKPVWGMLNDTAYTLQGGEWNIDLWGPVNWGITDNLQIGTMFWIWFLQIPNLNLKFNLIPESAGLPAFSIGGSYSQFSIMLPLTDSNGNKVDTKVNISWFNIGGYLTKQLTEKLYLSGGYIYNGFNASSSVSTNDFLVFSLTGTGNASKILMDLIIESTKSTRFFTEGVLNLGNNLNFDAGGGVEWAMGDIFRLKIGIYVPVRENLIYLPFIDLHWRFK